MDLGVSKFIQAPAKLGKNFELPDTLTESNVFEGFFPSLLFSTEKKEKNNLALAIKQSPHFCVVPLIAYLL